MVTTNKNHQIAYDNIDPISISFTVGGSATGWTSAITYTPVDANFITRSSSEGTDQRGAVTITATPTVNTGVERTAIITLTTTGIGTPATQMIVIRQGEANITISRETLIVTTNKNHQIAYNSTNPIPITFTVGGGATGWTSEITYTPVDANFITRSPTEGTDITGAVTLHATPTENMNVERSAAITFTTTGGTGATASATVTITQRAAPPTLVISTSDQTIDHNAGDFTITFDLGGGAMGWESSVTGAGFITLDPSMNTTSTQETVIITATSGLNDGLERKDTIIFTTTGDIADTVVITQRAAPPTLVISTSDQTINHNAGDFTITFDLGGGAIGWESSVTGAGFITLDSSMNTTSTQENSYHNSNPWFK